MEPDEPTAAPRPPDPADTPTTPSGDERPAATPSGEWPSPPGAASPSGFPPAPLGPPAGAPPPGPVPGAPPPGPPPGAPPSRDVNRILFIGLSALIVVLLAVGAFVLLGDDDTTASTSTTSEPDDTTTTTEAEATTTTTESTTTTTATESTAPASTHVSSGGLTFTRLPEPWLDWATDNRTPIAEIPGAAGQYVVVQELTPSGGQWVSNLLIGDLNASFDYGGEDDLATTTQTLSDRLIANYYVEGAESSVVREQSITIDGRPGYFMHHELTFVSEGLETTREKVVVVLVDTGRARPGVFWASIPYNRIDLNEGMDEVYRTLRVND